MFALRVALGSVLIWSLLPVAMVFAEGFDCGPGTIPCIYGYNENGDPNFSCMDSRCVCLLEPLPGGSKELCPTSNDIGGSLFFSYLSVGGMFSWGLGIGAALAILNVTIGGFQIMTGGADPGAVEAGKIRIFGSILGLIFLMFAGVFLNFINPVAFGF